MIIKRVIQAELETLMEEYPVVTITGPRQSGKTTLARMVYPDYTYCNLENPEIRNLAINDPNAFFNSFKWPIIIDEIQRVPQLLSYIQTIVDEHNKNGMFLLTGSHQLSLGEAINQSLAGRTALLRLLPFSISELQSESIELGRDELIYRGFQPRIYDQNQNPTKANRNYLQTYIERDVRQIMQIKDLGMFENFIRLLAGRVGQVLNLHSISRDLGVSSTSLAQWLSVLEASFVIFKLPPYYKNIGKRLIKSSKIYFTDVGLVSYLLGIENPGQVMRYPLLGGLFENMVVMELVKARLNNGLDPKIYFYRDNNSNEVDLILDNPEGPIPVEVKAAMTFNEKLVKGVGYFQKIYNKAGKGQLVYSGNLSLESKNYNVINFKDVGELIW